MKKLLPLLLLAILLTGCAQPAPEQTAPPIASVPESNAPASPSLPEDQSPEPEEAVPESSTPAEEPDEPESSAPAEEPGDSELPADPDAKPLTYVWEFFFDLNKELTYKTVIEDLNDRNALREAFGGSATDNQYRYSLPLQEITNAEEWNAYFAGKPIPENWFTPLFQNDRVYVLHFPTASNGDRYRIAGITLNGETLTLQIHQTAEGYTEAEGYYTAVIALPKSEAAHLTAAYATVMNRHFTGLFGALQRIDPVMRAASCKLDEPGYEQDGNELEALFAKASNANRLESGEDEVPAFFLETAEAFEGFCSEVGARRINGKPEDLQAFFEEYSLCALYIPVIHHHIYVLKSMESKGGALRFLVEKSYDTLQDVEEGQVFFIALPKDTAKIYDRFEAGWAS